MTEPFYELSGEPRAPREQNPYLIPIAIVIAGLSIAGAVVYSRNAAPGVSTASLKGAAAERNEGRSGPGAVENIKPVAASDHLRGNPKAPLKIVEFSDLECPFCKRFHETLQQVMLEYGKKGQVAWVYRHFPLESLHPKAPKEAEAAECAAEVGGNEKFWAYIDRLFSVTPSNNGLDLLQLPQIAQEVGLDRRRFEQCLQTSSKFADRITADYQDAVASGGAGTPYSVLITPDDRKFVISGAQPYPAVKQIIEKALTTTK